MKTTIFVATHKMYRMPTDPTYLPVWAGAETSRTFCGQFAGDNTGDNISAKNSSYNELSVLYWGWKNVDADIKGLAHYRRLFGSEKGVNDYSNLLASADIERLLVDCDAIVTPKRRFYFLSTYKHYVLSQSEMKQVHKNDLDTLRSIISKMYPEYLFALDCVYRSNSAHMLNMFIMKSDLFDKYCNWLFAILSEMEKQINRFRVLGAMGEFLLDVFIKTNGLKIKEMPLVELEKPPFFKKIGDRINRMVNKEQ